MESASNRASLSVIATEIAATYGVEPVGETRDMVERFYAIASERPEPGGRGDLGRARESLFGERHAPRP